MAMSARRDGWVVRLTGIAVWTTRRCDVSSRSERVSAAAWAMAWATVHDVRVRPLAQYRVDVPIAKQSW